MLVAGKYYEFQCNKHIVEEFYPEASCRIGKVHPKLDMRCDLEPEEYMGYNLEDFNFSALGSGG